MIKILEIIAFGCIGGMIYAFLGPIAQQNSIGWPIFWMCAGGSLAIILYRNRMRKTKQKNV
ncbi:MAG: hypothetical protein R1F52_05175 [Candidatus Nitrosoabyssus spongiisocia]|nr:MAG: hypothetical protein R1F52_05175 [Nitrosopumilaceae archaeon AB1(1)]